MNLLLRCLWIYLLSLFQKKKHFLETSKLSLSVLLNDLDVYWHLNNGRYLNFMDLGRFDLILRSDLKKIAFQNQWNPIVASSFMRYRRPLHLFENFELQTRIVGWNQKWFFLAQRFLRGGQVHARGFIKGLFVGPEGSVPCEDVISALGHKEPSPPLPRALNLWLEAEKGEKVQ